jgi:Photosynthesis system II assembly factor YCF48/Putative zinc-finger
LGQPEGTDDRIDAVVARALATAPGDPTADCPDATALAAWYQRTLGAAERERIERHLAGCARCHVITAALARAADGRSEPAEPVRRPWRRGWRVAVPVLAAAIAFVFVLRAMRNRPHPIPGGEAARSPGALTRQAPFGRAAKSHELSAQTSAAKAPLAAPSAGARLPSASAAPPVSQPSHAAETEARSPGAPSETGGNRPRPRIRMVRVAQLIAIAPPDHSFTWLVGAQGAILMRDSRHVLHIQNSTVWDDLVSGSAPSSKVCWVVGKSGTLLRTTDGTTWEKVASPTSEDLIGVKATSEKSATVTATDGTTYTTRNGGTSWKEHKKR